MVAKILFHVEVPSIFVHLKPSYILVSTTRTASVLILARLNIMPFMYDEAIIELHNSILGPLHKKTDL